ncbi:MAG: hypothetical protein HQL03_03525 [Nitrospirae bacterium]|nr:hypothetical protein [Nitrospirota bacterium]
MIELLHKRESDNFTLLLLQLGKELMVFKEEVNGRFDKVEARLDKMDQRFDKIEKEMVTKDYLNGALAELVVQIGISLRGVSKGLKEDRHDV